MNCKEISRLIVYGGDAETSAPAVQFEIAQHSRSCKKCSEELKTNSALRFILNNHSAVEDESGVCPSIWEEARLVNRVKASIQAARENTIGTWEAAIISTRGWLAGFAAAAILLLILSGQLATTTRFEKIESPSELSSSSNETNEANHELANAAAKPTDEMLSSSSQRQPLEPNDEFKEQSHVR
ncbi:MAG: hypothetical protein ACKVZH_27040 [Blastocatellia bacterium]